MINGLSVRAAEKIAFDEQKPSIHTKPAPTRRDPCLADMEEKFIERLGAKVSIEGDFSHGVIRIEYYSMQDMERLYEIIAKQ